MEKVQVQDDPDPDDIEEIEIRKALAIPYNNKDFVCIHIRPNDLKKLSSKYEVRIPPTFCIHCGRVNPEKTLTCKSCTIYKTKDFIPILIRKGDYDQHSEVDKKFQNIEQGYCYHCGTLRRLGSIEKRDEDMEWLKYQPSKLENVIEI